MTTDNPDLAKAVSNAHPGLFSAVEWAIREPGRITPRDRYAAGTLETEPHWQARAVLEAVRPFLAKAALDDSDRPHVEEARRILAGEVRVPASYGTERAYRDAGRTLLDLLDKLAPRGEAGG